MSVRSLHMNWVTMHARAMLLAVVCALAGSLLCASASSVTVTNYIAGMQDVDPSIFAIATSLYNGLGGLQPDNTLVSGPRTYLSSTGLLTTNTLGTAFRADTFSELFVAMSALLLDSMGSLPCGFDVPLAASVLPSFFENYTYLHNVDYPTAPITLRNLLEHTSTISEYGFDSYNATTPVTEELPTLDDFVTSLFNTSGTDVFLSGLIPGQSSSFYFSRTNIALASYVVNTQLVLMQTASGVAEEDMMDIGAFIASYLLPPLGMDNTFVLDRLGRKSNSDYPPNQNASWLQYIAMQDVDADGSAVVTARTIHPAYMADFMVYTTMNDLIKLISGVLIPGSLFYSAIGARLLSSPVAVSSAALPFITHRSLGVFNFSLSALCSAMTSAVSSSSTPYCAYDSTNSASDTSAFGLFGSGEFDQVGIVCFPALDQPWCSSSAVTYFRNASNMLSTRLNDATAASTTFYEWSVLLSVASLAEFTSLPQTTTSTTSAPTSSTTTTTTTTTAPKRYRRTKDFGLYTFLGVAATIVVVVGASYVTDYFIQPAPPAKIVVPVPAVPTTAMALSTGLGGGTPGYESSDDGGGGGQQGLFSPQTPVLRTLEPTYDEAVDTVSPDAFRGRPADPLSNRRLRLDDEVDDDRDSSLLTTSTLASSSSKMRRRRKGAAESPGSSSKPTLTSSSNSPSGTGGGVSSYGRDPSDGRSGADGGGTRGIPHFDAYV